MIINILTHLKWMDLNSIPVGKVDVRLTIDQTQSVIEKEQTTPAEQEDAQGGYKKHLLSCGSDLVSSKIHGK